MIKPFQTIRLAYLDELADDPEVQKAVDYLGIITVCSYDGVTIEYPESISLAEQYKFGIMLKKNTQIAFTLQDGIWTPTFKLPIRLIHSAVNDVVNAFRLFFWDYNIKIKNGIKTGIIMITRPELDQFNEQYDETF